MAAPAARQITRSEGSSTQLAKTVLIFCWFISVAHIWLASDGSDVFFDTTDYDALVDEKLRLEGYAPPLDRVANDAKREENLSTMDSLLDDDSSTDGLGAPTQNSLHRVDTELRNTQQSTIPEALQPVTYDECCVPAIQAKKYDDPADMKCFGTCFNERACTDPSYPYANMEEMKKYGRLRDLAPAEKKEMRERCVYKPPWLVPNVTWCSGDDNRIDPDNVYGNVPEPGCSHATNGGGSGPWQHVFIFPSAKLAFCGIPKGKSCLLMWGICTRITASLHLFYSD